MEPVMGALYVKDHEAFAMAQELAEKRGLTKAAAVKLALANELARDRHRPSLVEAARELRRTSTLPRENSGIADKAFFDDLYDQ
ncbi:type II toxin-antitoxin system VapB family antitoxin [Sphingomonas sp. KR1UV-12]|uniref:Type II toxin-antitoxin system VapB family antitoxin n=1 Tax=Sphingomonas aurea TaxID=3063994 RepID=A0ABT9EMQ9_9SPHN|nr:type II toxin-antitoxin system VapB family antitoxin [Sphingomonas sp. KR1UV-12]MDP1028244.1 type II toxin-antitoxin system VapB family antitoxin [Sphingomonas sp. KR1UV-12]